MAREGSGVLPFATTGGAEADGPMVDVQYGREVTLPIPNYQDPSGIWLDSSTGPPVDLVWARWPEPRQATLTLRVAGPIVYSVYVTVTMTLGGNAKFSRTFPLSPGVHTSLRVFGKSISVSAFAVGIPSGPLQQKVVGAITEGDLNPLGDLVALWSGVISQGGYGCAMTRAGFPTSGYLLSLSGFLWPFTGAAVVGTSYYLQAFDVTPDLAATWVATVGTNVQKPILVLGPLVGGGNPSFSFDRSLRPSVRFVNGVGLALSTRADAYVAPPAVVGFFVSGDYGL